MTLRRRSFSIPSQRPACVCGSFYFRSDDQLVSDQSSRPTADRLTDNSFNLSNIWTVDFSEDNFPRVYTPLSGCRGMTEIHHNMNQNFES